MEEGESFDDFDQPEPVREADRLTLDLDGWEGPLDLLLTLARGQKVDLAKISILALVEQYLAFIADAKKLKLEIAADYLVMAAWLAYLKSCLLLPRDTEADPSPEELAMRLQLRLQRLAAMREAGARLLARDRLGRDVFLRGAPEGLKVIRKSLWQANLYDLISAYGSVRARTEPAVHIVTRRPVMTLDEALGVLVGHLAKAEVAGMQHEVFRLRPVPLAHQRTKLFCDPRHEATAPGIRGASEAVKKQYRSTIAEPKLSRKNAVAQLAATDAFPETAANPAAVAAAMSPARHQSCERKSFQIARAE